MLYILLKSGACLAVFMIFYKVALEKQPFHHFKRAYLLGALIVSGVIPFLTFTNYVDVVQDPNALNLLMNDATLPYMDFETLPEEPTNYWPFVLWSIYGIGVLIFGVKFILNLKTLYTRIQHNEKRKASSFIHVLLQDILPPHTFFNYIFLNKSKFEDKAIPQEVLLHEETHARQKHSIDVLFIELLQVIFWFNPLLYFIKRDIKLNHEFLADAQVLKHGISAKNYQNTLLQFSSPKHDCQLANAINYSSTRNAVGVIKKRFTLMKTQSSPQRKWLVGLLIVPLLAGLVYSFSNHETVEVYTGNSNTIHPINVDIKEENKITLNGVSTKRTDLISKIQSINAHLSKSEIMEFVSVSFIIPNKTYVEFVKDIQKDLRGISIYNSSTAYYDGLKNVNKKAKHSSFYAGLTIVEAKAKRDEMFSPENMAEVEKSIKNNPQWSYSVGVDYVEEIQDSQVKIYREVSETYHKAIREYMKGPQTNNSELKLLYSKAINMYKAFSQEKIETHNLKPVPPAPAQYKTPKESIKQNPPTKKELADYNSWAKAINDKMAKAEKNKSNDYPIVKQKDIIRHKDTYDRMTETQRNSAQPWPNFPPPPPPPPPPLPEEAIGNLKDVHINSFNYWAKYLKGENPNPRYTTDEMYEYYYKMYNAMTDEQKKKTEGLPPPPPPKSKKPKQVAETEIETIIEQEPKKVSKEVIDRYAKAHPEAVTKAKINGQIEEIVEIPEDQEGTTTIYGVNYRYVIKDGVTKYYAPKGKSYTEEEFKALIKAIEAKQPKTKTSGKNEKGGPNANAENLHSDKELKIRQVILHASKNQSKPLTYQINGSPSSAEDVETFIEKHQDANVSFIDSEKSILNFSDNIGTKMSLEDLQKVYTKVFKNYKKSNGGLVIEAMTEPKNNSNKGGPNTEIDSFDPTRH
ncbi:M56 family metallopeptidase [Winogradskyella maritima]|uniref:M56 family metallopeptidase n=1 Tax=Winogradskyella maritima TaxID=1517766 RepID=A0ABV8AG01_9FLAO|nr:M56 family metallopeptidase [Winogradskyella maritima]